MGGITSQILKFKRGSAFQRLSNNKHIQLHKSAKDEGCLCAFVHVCVCALGGKGGGSESESKDNLLGLMLLFQSHKCNTKFHEDTGTKYNCSAKSNTN